MQALGGPAPYWHSYDHDQAGNRVQETLRSPGDPAVVRDYHYPDAGDPQPHAVQEVTEPGVGQVMDFAYDPAGNTTMRDLDGEATQQLEWDAEGNIESLNTGTRMVYDPDGQRILRDDGQTATLFLPMTELVWDKTHDELEATRYFSHEGQVVATCTGDDIADWRWMGVDHHGTTTTHSVNAFTAVEDVRRMDPYGNPRGPQPLSWPGQQAFVGGVQDPTGLIHIGARSYDPLTGRFLSVDPLMAIFDSQQINGYNYANYNPITFTDPTGLFLSKVGDFVKDTVSGVKDAVSGIANSKFVQAAGDVAIGFHMGYNSWGEVTGQAIAAFIRDPIGTAIAAANAVADTYAKWFGRTGSQPTSMACAITGVCEAAEHARDGDYQEAGRVLGHVAVDLLVSAAATAATAAMGPVAGAGTRVAGLGASTVVRTTTPSRVPTPNAPARNTKPNAPVGTTALDLFDSLPRGKQSGVRIVSSEDELRNLFGQMTSGAEQLPARGPKIPEVYQHADGTVIQWRGSSLSGGATIDIFPPDRKGLKVHVEVP